MTDVARLKHCRSKDNPADHRTRGLDTDTLSNSTFWLRGPQWLAEPTVSDNGEGKDTDDFESVTEDLGKQVEMKEKKSTLAFIVNNTDVNIFSKC